MAVLGATKQQGPAGCASAPTLTLSRYFIMLVMSCLLALAFLWSCCGKGSKRGHQKEEGFHVSSSTWP